MGEEFPKYLENPEKYCERINTLLQQNSDEWQTVWRAAIPELSNLQANEISMINSLLKPVESAFKSKDSNLRIQAFECWSYFIVHCENIKVSDKLWNVLLIPLLAHNHSVRNVLDAKLKTWHIFVDTNFITKPSIMKKAIPSILKCLYGPHSLGIACEVDVLSKTCGELYHKIMVKCAPFDETIDVIFSYLERAIPPLNKNTENTLKIAKLIWSDALRIISEKEWPKNYFTYLMRTLENLISGSKNDSLQLISNFLSILVNIYGSFPPDRLTPHMNLVIRCLFHPPVNAKVVRNIMNSILRVCEKPSFFFHQLDVVLSTAESNKNDTETLWIAGAFCYKNWIKNNRVNEAELPNHDYSTACKILLFPLDKMCELSEDIERFNLIMKTWKLCYEECATSAGTHCDKFVQSLTEKMDAQIEKASKQETNLIPTLKVAILLCNTILTLIKFSDGFSYVKPVLHKISKNSVHLKKLLDSDQKSFAVKYVVTVLSYVKLFPAHSEDFSHIIKTFGPLIPKDVEELVQKPSENKSDEDSDSSGKLSNGVDRLSAIVTPLSKAKLRTSFLERLSPAGRKSDVVEPQVRSQTTPKTSKIDDDDVEFVEIKSKPKNSPLTTHQQEIAKSNRYIPALYQDLSQSQSQSQSESVSILSGNKKVNDNLKPEFFEENANLPSVTSVQDSDIVPSSLSFRSGLNASAEKCSSFASKKLQFNEKKYSSEESEDSTDIILQKKLPENDNENLPPIMEIDEDQNKEGEKPSNKRKNSKAIDPLVEVTPKRSRRLSSRLEGSIVTKMGPKSRTKAREDKKRKSTITIDDESTGKEESDVEVIYINDDDTEIESTESQNLFVKTSASKRTSVVSSPLNSLMNVKGDESTGKKRKSLRARKSTTPLRSPIPTRRRSNAIAAEGMFNYKKSLFTDSIDDVPCAGDGNDLKCGSNVKVIVSDLHLPTGKKFIIGKQDDGKMSVTQISDKESSDDAAKESSTDTDNENVEAKDAPANQQPTKSSPNRSIDSVIIVEEPQCEVISLDDSECPTQKKVTQVPYVPENKPISEDVSDESTFFEGSEDNAKKPPIEDTAKNPPIEDTAKNPSIEDIAKNPPVEDTSKNPPIEDTAKKPPIEDAPINKGVSVIRSTNQPESTVSPEILTSTDVTTPSVISDTYTVCENNEDAVSSEPIVGSSSTSASNESVSILDVTSDNSKATEQTTPERSNTQANDQEKDKTTESNQKDKDVASRNNVSISPIHDNSRASQMIKLACASVPNTQTAEPTKTYSKSSKRTKSPTPMLPVRQPSRRVSDMWRNLSIENKSTTATPPRICTTPSTENLTYTPKECTSPGILKKIDAHRNTSSPKRPKFVYFADKLTHTKEFHPEEYNPDDDGDEDSLISTGDGSNNNLINDDLKSQEVLYSPLRNCRDDIKRVIEFIFSSSCSKSASEHFQRMGVNFVGQLAGMSTVTANSIPAGDNRVQRLRQALKKYDDSITNQYESKGLRRPSARRRILKTTAETDKKFEVSSIIDLLEPDETEEIGTTKEVSSDNNENDDVPETNSQEKATQPDSDTNTKHIETETVIVPLATELEDVLVSEPAIDPLVSVPTAESEVSQSVVDPQVSEPVAEPEASQSVVDPQVSDTAAEPEISQSVVDPQVSEIAVEPQPDVSSISEPVVESSAIPDVSEPMEIQSIPESNAEQNQQNVSEESSKIDENVVETVIEPVKPMEVETVSEQIENKENVDPSVTSVIIESSQPIAEALNVDKESNEKANESANESSDYVCTDNGNIYDQDSSDRRSIVMKNIGRYSTISEVQQVTEPTEEENAVTISPEIVPVGVMEIENDDTDESLSIFSKDKVIEEIVTITDSESVKSSPRTVDSSNVIESQTSQSLIEPVCAQLPNEQMVEIGEETNVIESQTSQLLIEAVCAQLPNEREIVEIDEEINNEPKKVPETDEPKSEQSKEQDLEAIAARLDLDWNHVIKKIYPCYSGDRDVAKVTAMSILNVFKEKFHDAKLNLTLVPED